MAMTGESLRICLISREFPPETGWGGIATFVDHLAQGLAELGHDVEIVSLAKETAKTVRQDGLLVHRVLPHSFDGDFGLTTTCMPYSSNMLKASTALWQKFLDLHRKHPFDVVDTPEILAEGFYTAATRIAPLVIRLYTPHSKFIVENLHNITPAFDHQFISILERTAMLSADVITSPSEDLASYVAQDLNYALEDIAIVRNPIDSNVFAPQGTKAVPPDDRLTVLFVGRLEERKGISYLVEAIPKIISSVTNCRFLIVGDDTNTAADQKSVLSGLNKFLDQADCQKYVTFIPRVPLSELPSYYRSADVCVVPSVYDNSPYTCLEAMSCGKPVVGTTSGGTREYLSRCGILVPPRDSAALAEAIINLLQDETERQRLGSLARARVLAEFQRKEIAARTTRLYQQAIARFQMQPTSRLYRKNPSLAVADAEFLVDSCNKMLYDLLYRESFEFRMKHWLRLAVARPRLFLAKLFFNGAVRLLSIKRPVSSPQFIMQLERAIESKEAALVE